MVTNNKTIEFEIKQQEISYFAKLLSHPARVAIIQLLAEKHEIRTGNISDYLPISRTTVSQHLKELRNAGVIQGEIDGLKIHYCLNMDKLMEIKSAFNSLFDQIISDFSCQC